MLMIPRQPRDLDFSMTVTVVHDGLVRANLAGELDHCSATLVATGLADLRASGSNRAAPHGRTALLDLSALTFLDTAGLRCLTDTRSALVAQGWRVCLTRPRGQVLRLLDLAVQFGWLPGDLKCWDDQQWTQPPDRALVNAER